MAKQLPVPPFKGNHTKEKIKISLHWTCAIQDHRHGTEEEAAACIERTKTSCDCEDWATTGRQIVRLQLSYLMHGYEFSGPRFRYCPWCGSALPDADNHVG